MLVIAVPLAKFARSIHVSFLHNRVALSLSHFSLATRA